MPTFNGTIGNDWINGSPAGDIILALAGDDVVNGLDDGDFIVGNQGNDILEGGGGRDTLRGGKGNDALGGGEGADALFGDADSDVILAGSGSDFAVGGKGSDRLEGEAGNDTLSGDLGADILSGGADRDFFVLTPSSGGQQLSDADLILDFLPGIDAIALAEGLTLANLAIAQVGNDTIIRLQLPDTQSGDYLAILRGVNASTLSPSSFVSVPSAVSTLAQFSLPEINPTPSSSTDLGGTFISVDQGVLTANFGSLRPPTATEVRNNLFGTPIVANPLAGITPFVNPAGTQLIRDPATGEFVPFTVNQPGSIFSPGGLPTTPGITEVVPGRLPAGPVGVFYLDASGIPRPASELTLAGGSIPPFINPEGDLVEAVPFEAIAPSTPGTPAFPPLFFDFQGVPRLPSELAPPILGDPRYLGFTGEISPLLTPTGEPILAREAVLGTPPTF